MRPRRRRSAACTRSSPGDAVQGGSGEVFDVTDPATGEVLEQVVLADAGDVDAAVAAARAAFPAWSAAPPVERSAALTRLAAAARRAGRRAGRAPRRRQTGKPIRLSTGFDVPGTIDNVAFFAGAARTPRGQGRRGVLRRPHVVRPARGDRRGRLGRAVELPAADGRLEGPAGDGRRQHDRPQARRAHAADLADAGRGRRRGGHPRRGGQRGDRHRAGGRRGPDGPPGRRHGVVHRLVRGRAAG